MPTIQSLKKQLRGIRSTRKLTKAMRTVSTIKFSKLNTVYGQYSAYGNRCRKIYDQYGEVLLKALQESEVSAPAAVIVMASNKGLCGSFNAEVLNFASEELSRLGEVRLFACGKKAVRFFRGQNRPIEKEYILNDIPSYEESNALLEDILNLRRSGSVSKVYVIYSKYDNMMSQTPVVCELFSAGDAKEEESILFVPDRRTIMEKTALTIFRSMFYELVLESALGVQAATLMTMRSAFDTATQVCAQLEGQINRKRQSAVTADVIETSSEREESFSDTAIALGDV